MAPRTKREMAREGLIKSPFARREGSDPSDLLADFAPGPCPATLNDMAKHETYEMVVHILNQYEIEGENPDGSTYPKIVDEPLCDPHAEGAFAENLSDSNCPKCISAAREMARDEATVRAMVRAENPVVRSLHVSGWTWQDERWHLHDEPVEQGMLIELAGMSGQRRAWIPVMTEWRDAGRVIVTEISVDGERATLVLADFDRRFAVGARWPDCEDEDEDEELTTH